MHRVNDDLFDHIEVRKARQLAVVGRELLDKVLPSGGGGESTMLVVGPTAEHYNRQVDKYRACRVHDSPPS